MKNIMKVMVSLIFLSSASFLFADSGFDRQIGIVFLKNAATNYLSAQYEKSEEFLAKSQEFFPESSDYEYIRALIAFNRDNNLPRAIAFMKKAIENNDWLFLEKKKCIKDISQLLLRTKKYQELVTMIEANCYIEYNDNDLMYIYLLGLKNIDEISKFAIELKKALKDYPKDYRFAELYLIENPVFANDIIDRKHIYSNKEGMQKIYLKASLLLTDEMKRKEAIENYFSMGGKALEAQIEYFKITGLNTEEELNKLLKENLYEKPQNIVNLEKILGHKKLREIFQNYCSTYSGNVYYDLNEDNYYEELYLYENGKPLGISIDNNQDGIIEFMVVFDNSEPTEIIVTDDEFTRIVYDRYPNVKEVIFSNGEEKQIYSIFPESLSLVPYFIKEEDKKIIIDREKIENFIDKKDLIFKKSIKVLTYKEDVMNDSIGFLKNELEKRSESYSLLKVYDKILGNIIYQNVNNKKTVGFIDVDFDNLIDLKEEYKDGKILSIEVDDNKNGIYNYKILFKEKGNISFWDFNEDGIYDCKQYTKDGFTVNEYASALDGHFDVIERSD